MNVVVLQGTLSREPEERTLPSGDRLIAYEVTVAGPNAGGRAESVPVAWHDPPAEARDLRCGDEVAVLGRVRRRFFRVGGATQSRTEVLAERVVPAAAGRRVSALVRAGAGRLAPAQGRAAARSGRRRS